MNRRPAVEGSQRPKIAARLRRRGFPQPHTTGRPHHHSDRMTHEPTATRGSPYPRGRQSCEAARTNEHEDDPDPQRHVLHDSHELVHLISPNGRSADPPHMPREVLPLCHGKRPSAESSSSDPHDPHVSMMSPKSLVVLPYRMRDKMYTLKPNVILATLTLLERP